MDPEASQLEILWRNRRIVAVTLAIVFATILAVLAAWPSSYWATCLVSIEGRKTSPEMLQASITAPIDLKIARQELFARPLLDRLRQDLGIKMPVSQMRAMLDVKLEGENALELAVTGPDADDVAKIANHLPELYVAQALRLRHEQMDAIGIAYTEALTGPSLREYSPGKLQALASRVLDADIALKLEKTGQGAVLRVLSPAVRPTAPHQRFGWGGALLGAGFGAILITWLLANAVEVIANFRASLREDASARAAAEAIDAEYAEARAARESKETR